MESNAVRGPLGDTLKAAVVEGYRRDVQLSKIQVPDSLFHLTDIAGLIGVVTTGQLWASLAGTSNDASEVRHGIALATDILRARHDSKHSEYETALMNTLGSSLHQEKRIAHSPFVVSFCRRPTKSAQWLHYGRSGCGVAIGFDSSISTSTPYDPIQVDYIPSSQTARIESFVDCVVPFLDDIRTRFPAHWEWAVSSAAGQVTIALSWVAAQMKHPSFDGEDEYRLLRQRFRLGSREIGPSKGVPIRFRAVGDRLIPFEAVEFPRTVIREVILGYSSTVSEDALRMLLRENEIDAVVSRSEVPVR